MIDSIDTNFNEKLTGLKDKDKDDSKKTQENNFLDSLSDVAEGICEILGNVLKD
jgi:hypothetical protein